MKRDPEFQWMVQRFVEGQATAAEVERINERLRRDAEARLWFIELLDLDSALADASLAWAANEEFGPAVSVTPASPETPGVERQAIPLRLVKNKPRWKARAFGRGGLFGLAGRQCVVVAIPASCFCHRPR